MSDYFTDDYRTRVTIARNGRELADFTVFVHPDASDGVVLWNVSGFVRDRAEELDAIRRAADTTTQDEESN